MCFDALAQLRLREASNQKPSSGWPNGDGDAIWCFTLSFVGRLVVYFALLGVIILIISLILKWLDECQERIEEDEEEARHETNPLLPNKVLTHSYGTCHEQQDLESGNCDSSSSSTDKNFYDGKICIICYDKERNCFFVPCGHCATCHACALRIFYEENRICPVCRRFIGKVRNLST